MNNPPNLQAGNVRLQSVVSEVSPLEPFHKAVLLVFFYFAKVAANKSTIPEEKQKLEENPPDAASEFLKTIEKVNVRADSIKEYIRQVIVNIGEAGQGLKWNRHTMAQLISKQVTDVETFDKVSSFLMKNQSVSHNGPFLFCSFASADSSLQDEKLTPQTQWLMATAWRNSGDGMGSIPLRTYWSDIVRTKRPVLIIEDPPLEEAHNEDPGSLTAQELIQRQASLALENSPS